MSAKPFSEQIKSHRERLGISRDEAAAICGVTPRTIYYWEDGAVPHRLTQFGAIRLLESTQPKKTV